MARKNNIPQYLSLSYPYKADERTRCREYIIKLMETWDVPLEDLTEGFYLDKNKKPVFISYGLRTQARKMLRERKIKEAML